jgi:Tol biopolymer transport system component
MRFISMFFLAMLMLPPWHQTAPEEADADSSQAFIGASGNLIFFMSRATNLPGNALRRPGDIFVYDRTAGKISQIVIPGNDTMFNGGAVINHPSPDGRFVPFVSWIDVNGKGGGLYLLDRTTGNIEPLNVDVQGVAGNSSYPYETLSEAIHVSDDGHFVLFLSSASNLVSDDDNGSGVDIFLLDRETGKLQRVLSSVSSDFPEGSIMGGTLSGDGQYIAFESWNQRLIANDANNTGDVFLYERSSGAITLVSHTPEGIAGNQRSTLLDISPDGRFVLFGSDASDLVPDDTNHQTDIFLFDRTTGVVQRVSVGEKGTQLDDGSVSADMTPDARYIVFDTNASNASHGHRGTTFRKIFRLDRQTGDLTLISRSTGGGYSTGWAYWPSISSDGRFIAFEADATDLVPSDRNKLRDIFLCDVLTSKMARLNVPNPS